MSKRKTKYAPSFILVTLELIPVLRSKGKGRGKRVKYLHKYSQRKVRRPISQS